MAESGEAPPVPEGWEPRITSSDALEEILERLPERPGVYLMRDLMILAADEGG